MGLKLGRILKFTAVGTLSIFLLFICMDSIFPVDNKIDYCVVITDKDQNVLHAFLSKDEKWRMKADLKEINETLIKTILYKEDKYFYYHPGVNLAAVVRAAFNNLLQNKKTSGASTITMQVARLLYPAKRTYFNKVTEMFRSLQLEWHLSKDEILMLYLNLVPYGGNIEGVKAAAFFYFNVKPENINLSQSVILSIIPNRPNSLHPKKGTSIITKERNKWLKRMMTDHFLKTEVIQEALDETVEMPRQATPKKIPHLAIQLKKVHSASTTITTTIDQKLQERSEAIAYNHYKRLSLKNINNLSVLVIENKTRAVRVYIGSPDFNDKLHSGEVDGCNALRSPGSTLKPLVYAMAIDKGIITPSTVIQDLPINIDGYTPENFNAHCNGLVTASKALAFSLNIPAVELLNKTGLSDFTDKLRKNGFSSLKKDREMGLSVILGGCGVKATELAAMYSAFANGGEYMPIKYLTNDTNSLSSNLISDAAAYMITDMLTGLVRPDLPNNSESSIHIPKIAWKTGTSYGRRDAWSIGYNKKYTVLVWVGNFNGEGVPELTGADMATPLMFELFNSIDYNSSSSWYAAPRSTDVRLICSQSGLPPGEHCTDIITDSYIPGISDNKMCHHLREVLVSADEKYSYCMRCLPEAGYKKLLLPNLTPSLSTFYQQNGIEFRKSPPHNPSCTQLFTENAPVITSPVNNKEYLLEKNSEQQINLNCNVESDIATVYWYIDDQFLTKSEPGKTSFFIPSEGIHKISCSDDKGRNSDVKVTIRFY